MNALTKRSPTYSGIQGNVHRVERLGELTLTDTYYSPRLWLRPHTHQLASFGFLISGSFTEQFPMRVLSYGGRVVFFRPSELIHENLVSAVGAHCLYLELSSSWLDHVREYSQLPNEPSSFDTAPLEKLGNSLYQQLNNMDDVSPLTIEGLAYEIVAQFCRTVRVKRESNPPPWLRKAHDLLYCRFQQPLRLSEISREVGVHPVHMVREFRRYYGTTIGEFKRKRRIDFACDKLAHSQMPIIDIALESGFTQQPHFTTIFRRVTGVTPYQYRKLYAENPAADSTREHRRAGKGPAMQK